VRPALDVSALPTFAFGSRAVTWWGVVGVIAIEGMMFALLITTYFYLRGLSPAWPPNVLPPALFFGTLNTIVLVASVVPNHLVKRSAEGLDVRRTRLWLIVSAAFGVAFSVIRIFEFRALNVWWDDNAYGSIVWILLGFHTAHLLTDVFDTIVLAALLFTGPLEEKHLVDASENSFYWDFVVLSWLAIYGVLYIYPRFS
jgi:heme/copper-type cytochrome/quinol oxidase subunit 3